MKFVKFVLITTVGVAAMNYGNVYSADREQHNEAKSDASADRKSCESEGSEIKASFKILREGAKKPYYGTPGSAGADLSACVELDIKMAPGEIMAIPTGIAVEIPKNRFGMICSRSGLAKKGITIASAPGVIDSDYRGEIMVILINKSQELFIVQNGMRLAQLIVLPFARLNWTKSEDLSETHRGSGGFGSTGLK
jgi:dUTP pyrophosphatase